MLNPAPLRHSRRLHLLSRFPIVHWAGPLHRLAARNQPMKPNAHLTAGAIAMDFPTMADSPLF
jgi:hypothetical protein